MGGRRAGDHQANENCKCVSHVCHHSMRMRGPDRAGAATRGGGAAATSASTDCGADIFRRGRRLRRAPARLRTLDCGRDLGLGKSGGAGLHAGAEGDFDLPGNERPEAAEAIVRFARAGPRAQTALVADRPARKQATNTPPAAPAPALRDARGNNPGGGEGVLCVFALRAQVLLLAARYFFCPSLGRLVGPGCPARRGAGSVSSLLFLARIG